MDTYQHADKIYNFHQPVQLSNKKMFGLDEKTLTAIKDCLRHYPDIKWVKIYGSRAKGNYRRGSDIDLAFSCSTDYSANLLASLDNLPTPYLFDVTHYESLRHNDLKAHIDRIGVVIYQQEIIESESDAIKPLAKSRY